MLVITDRKTLHKTAEIYGAPDAVGHTLRCGARLLRRKPWLKWQSEGSVALKFGNARIIRYSFIETIIEFYYILHKKCMYGRRGRQKHHEFASLPIYIYIHRHPTTNSGEFVQFSRLKPGVLVHTHHTPNYPILQVNRHVHKSTSGMYPSALTTASNTSNIQQWTTLQFERWHNFHVLNVFNSSYTTITPEIICHIWKSNVLKLQRLPHALPRFEREAAGWGMEFGP